jgi:hypothetical protein
MHNVYPAAWPQARQSKLVQTLWGNPIAGKAGAASAGEAVPTPVRRGTPSARAAPYRHPARTEEGAWGMARKNWRPAHAGRPTYPGGEEGGHGEGDVVEAWGCR